MQLKNNQCSRSIESIKSFFQCGKTVFKIFVGITFNTIVFKIFLEIILNIFFKNYKMLARENRGFPWKFSSPYEFQKGKSLT